MKRFLLCILPLLLLLGGCHRAPQAAVDTLEERVERIEGALGKERFLQADEDFIETNLQEAHCMENGAIYLADQGDFGEWGVFQLKDASDAARFKQSLRSYLDEEYEAIRSLAELYPAEELEQRLAIYRDAVIGGKGAFVYYFALGKRQNADAIAALESE